MALLLKVNLDGTGSSAFFTGIVGLLSIVPIALPVAMKVYVHVFAGLDARMAVRETTWG